MVRESDDYITTNVNTIKSNVHKLGRELGHKQLHMLSQRLKFIFGPMVSKKSPPTLWRLRRSRDAYQAIHDIDAHLFLALVLSVSPTECGTTKFEAVIDHLRNLSNYDAFHFSLKKSTFEALEELGNSDDIADRDRFGRLLRVLKAGQYPSFVGKPELTPRVEQPVETTQAEQPVDTPRLGMPILSIRCAVLTVSTEIEYAFSQVPMERLQHLPALITGAISTSNKYVHERAQQERATTCVTIFLRPREEDGSIIITAGSRALYEIRHALGMSALEVNKT